VNFSLENEEDLHQNISDMDELLGQSKDQIAQQLGMLLISIFEGKENSQDKIVKLLKQIMVESKGNTEFTILTIFNLLRIYVSNFQYKSVRSSFSKDLDQTIQDLISNVADEMSTVTEIEILRLQSQINHLRDNYPVAKSLLLRADKLAQQSDLNFLSRSIQEELQSISR